MHVRVPCSQREFTARDSGAGSRSFDYSDRFPAGETVQRRVGARRNVGEELFGGICRGLGNGVGRQLRELMPGCALSLRAASVDDRVRDRDPAGCLSDVGNDGSFRRKGVCIILGNAAQEQAFPELDRWRAVGHEATDQNTIAFDALWNENFRPIVVIDYACRGIAVPFLDICLSSVASSSSVF